MYIQKNALNDTSEAIGRQCCNGRLETMSKMFIINSSLQIFDKQYIFNVYYHILPLCINLVPVMVSWHENKEIW